MSNEFPKVDYTINSKERALIASFSQIYPITIFCYVLFVLCFKWLMFMKIVLGIGVLVSSIPSFLSIFPALTLINNANEKIKTDAILSIKLGFLGLIEIICYYIFLFNLKEIPNFQHKWILLVFFVFVFIMKLLIDSWIYARNYKKNNK